MLFRSAFGIYFIIYQQIENNVISPTIQSKRIELSPLMVLMAVTIGLYMFGMVGGIVSIPIAGCAKVLATEYISRSNAAKNQLLNQQSLLTYSSAFAAKKVNQGQLNQRLKPSKGLA